MEEEIPTKAPRQTLTLGNQTRGTIEDQLPDIIQEILSRLQINSVFQSRLVSHQWRTLINNRRFHMMHYNQTISNQQQQSCSLVSARSSLRCIPDLNTLEKVIWIKKKNLPFTHLVSSFRIVGSVNGFMCLEDEKPRYMVIYNPVTGDWLKLPEAPILRKGLHIFFGFGYCVRSYQYKVVRMGIDGSTGNSTVHIVTVGDDTWRSFGTLTPIFGRIVKDIMSHILSVERFGVFVNGHVHWLMTYKREMPAGIRAFDVEKERFVTVPFPDSIEDSKIPGLLYLGVMSLGMLGGCLMLVDNSQSGVHQVWVMKNYNVKESWVLQYVIPTLPGHSWAPLKPLAVQKNGKLVALGRGRLYLYDPENRTSEELEVSMYEHVVLHAGTLVSLADVIARFKKSTRND